MKYQTLYALAAIASFAMAPALAQSDNLQVGSLHTQEAMLDSRLTASYNSGLIDSFELANMRRDLDAIRTKEESYRMSNNGLTSGGFKTISNRLSEFSSRLNHHGTKENVIAVPVIEYR